MISGTSPRHSGSKEGENKAKEVQYAVSVLLGHEDGGALVMARYGHPSKDEARLAESPHREWAFGLRPVLRRDCRRRSALAMASFGLVSLR
jgi:hypothetical protein